MGEENQEDPGDDDAKGSHRKGLRRGRAKSLGGARRPPEEGSAHHREISTLQSGHRRSIREALRVINESRQLIPFS
jgi:hypothetical protein